MKCPRCGYCASCGRGPDPFVPWGPGNDVSVPAVGQIDSIEDISGSLDLRSSGLEDAGVPLAEFPSTEENPMACIGVAYNEFDSTTYAGVVVQKLPYDPLAAPWFKVCSGDAAKDLEDAVDILEKLGYDRMVLSSIDHFISDSSPKVASAMRYVLANRKEGVA